MFLLGAEHGLLICYFFSFMYLLLVPSIYHHTGELDISSLQAALGPEVTKARPLREGLTEVLQKILVG